MVHYFNPKDSYALSGFCKVFGELLQRKAGSCHIVLVCIGSDRATGDCLGPIIGHKLKRFEDNFSVYGTLEKPVHAKNLGDALCFIKRYHPDSLVIAIDASLGTQEHIGFITLGEGCLYPGVGVEKDLPDVGDIFITGIVNQAGGNGHMLLQTTHLNTVMKLADFICSGLYYCLKHRSAIQCTK